MTLSCYCAPRYESYGVVLVVSKSISPLLDPNRSDNEHNTAKKYCFNGVKKIGHSTGPLLRMYAISNWGLTYWVP